MSGETLCSDLTRHFQRLSLETLHTRLQGADKSQVPQWAAPQLEHHTAERGEEGLMREEAPEGGVARRRNDGRRGRRGQNRPDLAGATYSWFERGLHARLSCTLVPHSTLYTFWRAWCVTVRKEEGGRRKEEKEEGTRPNVRFRSASVRVCPAQDMVQCGDVSLSERDVTVFLCTERCRGTLQWSKAAASRASPPQRRHRTACPHPFYS